MGTKKRVTEEDICMKSMISDLCLRNWQGKILVSSVVRIQNDCCRPKTINRTPETTKQEIVWPEFQG